LRKEELKTMRKFRKILTFLLVTSITLSANAQSTLKERLEQHVYTLASDSLQGRKAGTDYSRMAADYIVEQLERIGIEPYLETSFLQTFNCDFQNVVGIIRGNDSILKHEYIIVGAHYDHIGVKKGEIYNGADDNASGVAVLIELGRELKRDQSNLKRSIILVAFDAEEIGLLGSKYFSNHPNMSKDNIKLMISIDMVGWFEKSGKVKYHGSGTIKNGKELILNEEYIPKGLNVVAKKFEEIPFKITDTGPFAKKGIPTLWITTGIKSPYHKPQDEAHLIDYDGMALITENLKNVVEAISQDDDFQSSGKVAKKLRPQSRFIFGISANIGSNFHHYTKGIVNGKATVSYGVGLMSQINFRYFAIRPEVHYDRIRAKHPAGTIATDNLTVPLSLVVPFYLNSVKFADLFFGGYYGYRFEGKQDKKKIDFENTFNRNEGGLTFGLGIYLRPIRIGYASRMALTNFTKSSNDDNAHIRNRTNYFTITYIF
jgi:hypothetical protein